MSEEIGAKEKINNQIEVDKEILSVLPKNNKKNLQAYKDKAAEIMQGYKGYSDEIVSEIKRRVFRIKSFVPDEKIERLEQKIKSMEKIDILDNNTTSFEKMELDKTLYILRRFYKNNLELVNSAIVECLDKFKDVGVLLYYGDFNYSIYTKEYMTVFLEEMKKGDINSIRIKDTFEQIYWKCPDIIIHIELNFRSIYFRNEKIINKYFEDEKKRIIKELGLNEEEAIEKYKTLKNNLIETKNKDTALIIEKFLSNEIAPKDYEESSINKSYKKLLEKEISEFSIEEKQEINKNIFRLQNSLYELRNYLKYKFIYDSAIDTYKNKEKYKAIYNQKFKQIKKIETKLFKTNKKMEKYEAHKGLLQKLFNKSNNRLEKINTDTNAQILELRNVYRDLEESKINNIISTALNENSTIYDVLLLVCKFYSFLVNAIINEYPDIAQDEMQDTIEKCRRFIKYPRITIINNLKITDDKDILLMIKDKYNLCNINITKGDLEEENLPNLITTVSNICEYNYILNSKVTLQDIQFLLQAIKIVEENK